MMTHPILQAKKISKVFTYPQNIKILQSISLSLYAGQSLAIVGPSGEGKSTLLHILGTLDSPSSGELYIAGKNALLNNTARLRNQHIGFVFQSFHLLEESTALQNVLLPAFIAGEAIHKGSAAYKRGCMLLEQVSLLSRAHFQTKLLSGGEKQRVAIARALCNNPPIILADEPSGNLDSATSQKIHELLLFCVKKLHKGLIVVTHDAELTALCDKTYHLNQGILNE